MIAPGTFQAITSITSNGVVDSAYGGGSTVRVQGTASDGYVGTIGGHSLKLMTNGSAKATVFVSGGVYVGSAPVDPGADNLTVQGTTYIGATDVALSRGASGTLGQSAGAGADARYRISVNSGGTVGEYTVNSTVNAVLFGSVTAGDVVFTSTNVGRIRIYAGGGVYIGSTPSDPGINNLSVQGVANINGGYAYVAGTTGVPSVAANAQYILADGWRIIRSTPASASRAWDLTVSDTAMQYRVVDGAYTGAFTYMTVSRTGNTDASVRFDTATGVSIGMAAAGAGAPNSLSVAGNIGIGRAASTVAAEKISWTDGTRTMSSGCDINMPWFGTTTNHDIRFITNNVEKMRLYASGGVYIGTTVVDPGANNLTVQGTATVTKLASSYTGSGQAFNLDIGNTWNGSSGGGILGTMILALNHGGSAGVVANQIIRATYTKNSGAIAAGTTFGASGVELISTFNETETNGFTAFHSVPTVATGKTLNALTAFLAGGVGGAGTVTTLRAFVAETGAGASQFADGVYIGSSYSAPGANNLMVQGTLYVGATDVPLTRYGVGTVQLAYNQNGSTGFLTRNATNAAGAYAAFNVMNDTSLNGAFFCTASVGNAGYGGTVLAIGTISSHDVSFLSSNVLRGKLFASGGYYFGGTPTDPGANNLQVQGTITGNVGMVLNTARTGNTVRLYDNGSSSKWIRSEAGQFQILNNAFSLQLMTVDDAGNLNHTGSIQDNSLVLYAPSTGTTQTIADSVSTAVISNGTLASLTVKMPATPANGQIVRVLFGGAVTALTMTPNSGQTLSAGSPTTAAVGATVSYIYRTTGTTWYILSKNA